MGRGHGAHTWYSWMLRRRSCWCCHLPATETARDASFPSDPRTMAAATWGERGLAPSIRKPYKRGGRQAGSRFLLPFDYFPIRFIFSFVFFLAEGSGRQDSGIRENGSLHWKVGPFNVGYGCHRRKGDSRAFHGPRDLGYGAGPALWAYGQCGPLQQTEDQQLDRENFAAVLHRSLTRLRFLLLHMINLYLHHDGYDSQSLHS